MKTTIVGTRLQDDAGEDFLVRSGMTPQVKISADVIDTPSQALEPTATRRAFTFSND